MPAALYESTGIPFTFDARALLAQARAALVKSGTTTLHTGLACVPMVVTYQMHPLTYRLARRLIEVPHIALVNLVANERVVPELIQGDATPEALAQALIPLIADEREHARVQAALNGVRARLAGPPDGQSAAQRVAAMIGEPRA